MQRSNLNPQETREEKSVFTKDDVISVYTSDQAADDDILFSLNKSAFFKNKYFNFATTNLLLELEIMRYDIKRRKDVINISSMLDLLEQAKKIVLKSIYNNLQEDSFYCGDIRKHNGEMIKIFIEMNETGKLTLLLPSDH
ncbi:MAG: hypothetical protein V2A70_00775 [Candidatus Omnitrophota bacterium]